MVQLFVYRRYSLLVDKNRKIVPRGVLADLTWKVSQYRYTDLQ